jgi:hypothetical protein
MTSICETKDVSSEPADTPVLDVEIVRAATEVSNTYIATFTRRLSADFWAAVVAAEANHPYKRASGGDL